MEKDYEIIQNISLAEIKVEENQTPQTEEVQVEATSEPQTVIDEKKVEVEQPTIPSVEFDAPVNVDGDESTPVMDEVSNVEIPNNVTVAPVQSEVHSSNSGDDIDFSALLGNFNVNFDGMGGSTESNESNIYNVTANTEYDTNNYENASYDVASQKDSDVGGYAKEDDNVSYASAPSYDNVALADVNVNFKDEDSINNYYDRKREYLINEIEKERTAALDQCKKYNEMSTWVNEIGSSFNFFKGRKGY